jgi:hypothetical protein
LKEARDFANQRHVYDDKVLDCKVSLHHQDYITTSLNNIREPKKIFVDKIPKNVAKIYLEKTFGVYGEIEEIILIEKEKRNINFAYITYFDTESAQKCVTAPEPKICAGTRLTVVFARPKFSKKMLLEIPPLLKECIRQIQKGLKEYDPKDFVNLRVEVMGETSTAGSESNIKAGMMGGRKSMSVIKFTPVDGMFLAPQYPYYQQQLVQPGEYCYQDYDQTGQMFTSNQVYDQQGYAVYQEPVYYTDYVTPGQHPMGEQMMNQSQPMGNNQMMTQIPPQMGQMRSTMTMPAPTQGQVQGQGQFQQQEYYVQYVQDPVQAVDPRLQGFSDQNQCSSPRPTGGAYGVPQTFESIDHYASYQPSMEKNARVQDGYQYTSEYRTATNSEYLNSQYSTGTGYESYYYGHPQNDDGYSQNVVFHNQEIPNYQYSNANENAVYYERSLSDNEQYSGYSQEGYQSIDMAMGTGQDYSVSNYKRPCYKSTDHVGS